MPASRCTRARLSRSPARRARKSSLLLPSGSPRPADERPPDYGCEGTRPPPWRKTLAALRLAEVGFVSQFHFLLPEFSALENVTLPMQRLGRLPQPEIRSACGRAAPGLGLAGKAKKLAETAFRRTKPASCHRPRARQQSVADPGRPTDRQPRYRRQRQRAKDPDGPRTLLWPRRGRRHP